VGRVMPPPPLKADPAKKCRSKVCEHRLVLQDKLLEIPLDDHILHGTHCDLEEVGIGGVGEVSVYLLLRVTVQRSELVHEVLAGLLPVVWRSMIIGKPVRCDRALRQLLLEQIHFVEEED